MELQKTKDSNGGLKKPEELPTDHSAVLFQRAKQVLPGGTTRATVTCDPHPIYINSGQGAWLTDIDGQRYLDLNNNFTTLIHGHAFPPVVNSLSERLKQGTCYGNPTIEEIELAELICSRDPSAEKIRFVNTGTEAVMFAIKAARAYTGRHKIAKFEGAYHGSYDWAEVSEKSVPGNWGSLSEPTSLPNYMGTPPAVLEDTLVLPFNFYDETLTLLEKHANELSCVLIDLMPSRAGLIPIDANYLKMLRDFTRAHGILLISDEVLNFRLSYAGAAAHFDLVSDITVLGKIIGGGLPIGAIAGQDAFMSVFDTTVKNTKLSQGGTFSANPLSLTAGMVSMNELDIAAFEYLEMLGDYARHEISSVFSNTKLPFSVTGLASLFRIHPKTNAPQSYRDAFQTPKEQQMMSQLCSFLASKNILFNGLGAISTVMTKAEIDFFSNALYQFADNLKT